MRAFVIILTTIFSFASYSQAVEQEIIDQVWRPFTQSWESSDSETFNSLHTDDIVRIGSRQLMVGEEYKKQNATNMAIVAERGDKRKIEFAFDYQKVNGSIAYQMGFYKVTSLDRPGQPYIARFHVELRKVNGVWKIARDYDSNMIGNERVNSEMYEGLEFFHFE